MTIKEMHIEVNQSLQKVAANRTRKYLSEEIDWVLNKMQHRFIQGRIKPRKGGGYSLEQMNVDALRPILVSGKKIPAFIDRPDRYKCFLPPDYSYLISDASLTSELCKETAQVEAKKLYITWLKQVKTNKVDPLYYQTVKVTANADILNIPGNLPYYHEYTGYNRKEDIFLVLPWIVNHFQQLGNLQVGYELFGEYFKPSHYYFISDSAFPITSLVQDATNNTVQVQELKEFTSHKSLDTEVLTANRLESSENIHNLLSTAFYKTSLHSPISELSKNILYVYHDSSFTVNSCEITYIRKPRIVSLFLGSDCELPAEFHPTICDLATEYIKGRLENGQGQQIIERDNELRVII